MSLKVNRQHHHIAECSHAHRWFHVHFRDLQEKTDCPDILDREERLWVKPRKCNSRSRLYQSDDCCFCLKHTGIPRQDWPTWSSRCSWTSGESHYYLPLGFFNILPTRGHEDMSSFVILGTNWWDWTNGRSGPPWTPRPAWWTRSSWSSRKRRSQGKVCLLRDQLAEELPLLMFSSVTEGCFFFF